MLATLLTSIISFISTNIDDIFILMLFFAQEEQSKQKRGIFLGQYLGIGSLVLISLAGAGLAAQIPSRYIGFLGLIPIGLGLKEGICYLQEKKAAGGEESQKVSEAAGKADEAAVGNADCANTSEADSAACTNAEKRSRRTGLVIHVMLLAIANGADNLGVYIPLFAGYTAMQMAMAAAVFAVMVTVWCLLAQKAAALPGLGKMLRSYRHVIVPVVFVALGIYILL